MNPAGFKAHVCPTKTVALVRLSDEDCSFGQRERCSSECRNVAPSDQRDSFATKGRQRPAVNSRTDVGGDVKPLHPVPPLSRCGWGTRRI